MSDSERVSSGEEYAEITYEAAKKMTTGELRKEMNKRGLDNKGPKKTLLNRIRYYSGRGFPPTPKPSKCKQISGRKRKLEIDDDEQEVVDDAPATKKRRLNDSSSKASDKKEQDAGDEDSKSMPEPKQTNQTETEQKTKPPAIVKQATDMQQQQEIEPEKEAAVMEAVMEANEDVVVDGISMEKEEVMDVDVDDSPKPTDNKKEGKKEEETQSPDLMVEPQQNTPANIRQLMAFPSTVNAQNQPHDVDDEQRDIIGDVAKEEEEEKEVQVNDNESPFRTHPICDKYEMDVDDDIPIQEIGGLSVENTEQVSKIEVENAAEEITQIPFESEAEPEQNGAFVPEDSIQNT